MTMAGLSGGEASRIDSATSKPSAPGIRQSRITTPETLSFAPGNGQLLQGVGTGMRFLRFHTPRSQMAGGRACGFVSLSSTTRARETGRLSKYDGFGRKAFSDAKTHGDEKRAAFSDHAFCEDLSAHELGQFASDGEPQARFRDACG